MKLIRTDRIRHQYDVWQGDEKFKRTALDGVDLDVERGELIAILGANGSGKSTLAKHLNVLLLPDEGTVWIDGNVYLKGAKPWNREANKVVDAEAEVFVELTEKDGKPCLRTNVYDFIKDFRGGTIHSDLLGNAFEPDQRFEAPDGSAITFDRDYYGNHRSLTTLPGPFAEPGEEKDNLW